MALTIRQNRATGVEALSARESTLYINELSLSHDGHMHTAAEHYPLLVPISSARVKQRVTWRAATHLLAGHQGYSEVHTGIHTACPICAGDPRLCRLCSLEVVLCFCTYMAH